MSADFIISENIDVIVYGKNNLKFLESMILKSSMIKKNLSPDNSFLQKQQQQENMPKNTEKIYFKNVNKLLNLNDESNEISKPSNKSSQNLLKIPCLNWADFKNCSSTISTKNFWININFHLISDMFLDPYINNFVSANINLLVLTLNGDEQKDCKKTKELYSKLAASKPPSTIKYQSQMLLLQSGYYQAYNDNIVLALCELPDIEPLGPCCVIDFGKKEVISKDFEETPKNLSKFLKFGKKDENNNENENNTIVEFYKWIVETHQQLNYSTPLNENQLQEILEAVYYDVNGSNSNLQNKGNSWGNFCNII